MLQKDPSIKGYMVIHRHHPAMDESGKQSAAVKGYLRDHEGNQLDEVAITIDPSVMNDTNNTIEKVLASVRAELEREAKRRAGKS